MTSMYRVRLSLLTVMFVFLIAQVGQAVQDPVATAPTSQASNVSVTLPTNNTTATISWTRGNGAGCAVFIKQTIGGAPAPADRAVYSADSNLGGSPGQIGSTGWYCVYSGTGTSVTVSGLTANKDYRVMVCEFNGSGATTGWLSDYKYPYTSALTFYSTQLVYRSKAQGNWSSTGTWEKSTNGGATFGASDDYPNSSTAAVSITSGSHMITVDVNASAAHVSFRMTGCVFTVASGKTLTANVIPGPGFSLNLRGPGTISTLSLVNYYSSITVLSTIPVSTVNMTESAYFGLDQGTTFNGTITVPAKKELSLNQGANGSNPGTISGVTVLQDGILWVRKNVPITTLSIKNQGVIRVDGSFVWDATTVKPEQTVKFESFAGAATIEKVVMTRPASLYVEKNHQVTINKFDPGFTDTTGEMLDLHPHSSAKLTIKAYTDDAHLPGQSDYVSCGGSGEVYLLPGVNFKRAARIRLDVSCGKLYYGSEASPLDMELNDEGDRISINSDGVIATWGGITISPGLKASDREVNGPNVKMASSTQFHFQGTGKTLSAINNGDFELNGKTVFSGGKYTISGSYNFIFGNMDILNSAEVESTSRGQQWYMLGDSVVKLDNSAKLTLTAPSIEKAIVFGRMPTKASRMQVNGFTVNRASDTTTLALTNVKLQYATYTSPTGEAANTEGVDISSIVFDDHCSNWQGAVTPAPPSGGGGGQTDDAGDGETTDGETTVDVEGADADLPFDVETDPTSGDSTITIGDPNAPTLVLEVEGAGSGSRVNVAFGENDAKKIVVTNKKGDAIAQANILGAGAGSTVSMKINESAHMTVKVQDSSGKTSGYVKAYQDALGENAQIEMWVGQGNESGLYVTDPAGDAASGVEVGGDGAPAVPGFVLQSGDGASREISIIDSDAINDRPVFVVTLTDIEPTSHPFVDVQLSQSGDRSVGIADSSTSLAELNITGSEAGTIDRVDYTPDADGNGGVLTLFDRNRSVDDLSRSLQIRVIDHPTTYTTSVDLGENRDANIGVAGEQGEIFDVQLYLPSRQDRTICTLTYQSSGSSADQQTPEAEAVLPGFDGLGYGAAFGGAVKVEIDGIEDGNAVTLELEYEDADVAATEVDESDLRMYQLDEESLLYEPAGVLDLGDTEPTDIAGEYGIQTEQNKVWSCVTSLGTFAIGAPVDSYPDDPFNPGANSNVNDNDNENENDNTSPVSPAASGCGAGLCGAMGSLNLALLLVGMVMMKRRR